MTNRANTESASNASEQPAQTAHSTPTEQSTGPETNKNTESKDEIQGKAQEHTGNKEQAEDAQQHVGKDGEKKENTQGILDKIDHNVTSARDTLAKVAAGIAIAREILTKVEPLLDNKEKLKPLENTLETIDKRVQTGQTLLNKAASFLQQRDRAQALVLLREATDKVNEIQGTLQRVTRGVNILRVFAPLVGKKEEVHAIQNILHKITAAVNFIQEVLHKIIEFVSKPVQFSKQLTRSTKEGIDAGETPLEALKNAALIKSGLRAGQKGEAEQLQKAEGWGMIGNSQHLVLVWSGRP